MPELEKPSVESGSLIFGQALRDLANPGPGLLHRLWVGDELSQQHDDRVLAVASSEELAVRDEIPICVEVVLAKAAIVFVVARMMCQALDDHAGKRSGQSIEWHVACDLA